MFDTERCECICDRIRYCAERRSRAALAATRLRIDLDLAHGAAVGEGGQRRGLVVDPGHRAALRHLEQIDRTVGALDAEAPRGELDIGCGGFEHLGGELLALLERA